MNNIFLTVIHLEKTDHNDETAFVTLLQQFKKDLATYDKEGVPACVTVVAETGVYSCEVAIGVSCESEHISRGLNKLADSYRGTFMLQELCRA